MKSSLPLVLGFIAVPVIFTAIGLIMTAYGVGAALATLFAVVVVGGSIR